MIQDRGFSPASDFGSAGLGSAGPIWGSPQWNATNDPQHAADLAWFQGGGAQALYDRDNASEISTSGVNTPWYQNPGLYGVAALVGGAGLAAYGAGAGGAADASAVGGAGAGAGGSAGALPYAADPLAGAGGAGATGGAGGAGAAAGAGGATGGSGLPWYTGPAVNAATRALGGGQGGTMQQQPYSWQAGGSPQGPVGYGGGQPPGGDLSWLGPLLGGGAGIYGLTQGNRLSNPGLDPQQQALVNAGQQTYNTALDPQQALYGRTQQQLQDQVRASDSARGVAMSPYSAGVENKAMSDFNIDWQNQQLGRQVQGLGAMGQANTAATGIGQLGLANREFGAGQNASNMNAALTGLSGLTGGAGRGVGGVGMPGTNYLSQWYNSMFGQGGAQPPAGQAGMYGSNVDAFGNPISSNFSGGMPGNTAGPAGGGFNDYSGGWTDPTMLAGAGGGGMDFSQFAG